MKKIDLDLENCFGIKKLNGELSFGDGHTVLIYARNGLMKTSLTKTFKCIQDDKADEIGDVVYGKKGKAQISIDGTPIDPGQVMVVKSYEESYVSDVSQLLIDDELKEKFDDVIKARDDLLIKLQGRSGLKVRKSARGKPVNELMDAIVRDFGVNDSLIVEIDKLLDCRDEYEHACFGDIAYADLFNESVVDKITNDKLLQSDIEGFSRVTTEVYGRVKFFKNGEFTLPRLKNLRKDLEKESFFVQHNKIELTGGIQVLGDEDLKEQIERVESELITSNEYKKVANTLSTVGGVAVQNIIGLHPEIIDYMSTDGIEKLRRLVWLSYFDDERELFDEFCNKCHVLNESISTANIDNTVWRSVVDEFNGRFHMPFKMAIENRRAAISGEATPKVAFVYEDGNERRSLSREKLDGLDVLSQGEKRALYLLNILFDIKKLESTDGQVLLVIDDIADSFDYKNKYAIVEYLYELSQKENIYLLILSHNYDFHRTLASRLGPGRDWIYEASIVEDGSIVLGEEHYQNSPFMGWKKAGKKRTMAMTIALIPFLRNMIEYGVDKKISADGDFALITTLLHERDGSHNITYADLKPLYKQYLGVDISNDEIDLRNNVVDDIYSICNSMDKLNSLLENKVVVAMGIRHKAEEFMVAAVKSYGGKLEWKDRNDTVELSSADFLKRVYSNRNQTRRLSDGYKQFSNDKDRIKILDEVNIVTPDYIHLNSFMYEPLVDVDIAELVDLYNKVSHLESDSDADK